MVIFRKIIIFQLLARNIAHRIQSNYYIRCLLTAACTYHDSHDLPTQHTCQDNHIHVKLHNFTTKRCKLSSSFPSPTSFELFGLSRESSHVQEIFRFAVNAVEPLHMIENVLLYDKDSSFLTVQDKKYKVDNNVYVVGFGKAVLGMARATENILGNHIVKGILSIPRGQQEILKQKNRRELLLHPNTKIQVYEGGSNYLPDEAAYEASKAIQTLVSERKDTDIILVLISGGGSFLFPSPRTSITLNDLISMTNVLATHGASVKDINVIRKNVETLKGGGLVKAAYPAKMVSLIISDVIGDPLNFIASGPTVQDSVMPHQCFEIFNRLNIINMIPKSIIHYLEQQVKQESLKAMYGKTSLSMKTISESKSSVDADWSRIQNVLVGSNTIACNAAMERAHELGYVPYILTTVLNGAAQQIGSMLGKLGIYILMCFNRRRSNEANVSLLLLELDIIKDGISKTQLNEIANLVDSAHNMGKGLAIISGGESVVNITGNGIGGRNQEVVLAGGLKLHELYEQIEPRARADITLLSADTDGEDGLCPAAGAVVNQNFVSEAKLEGFSCSWYLQNNDSYTLFHSVKRGMHHVVTHMTGTQVMDIQVLIVGFPPVHPLY